MNTEIEIVNLTPHVVNIRTNAGYSVDIPTSGEVARVSVVMEPCGNVGQIPTYKATYGAIEGLPAPKNDTIFVVSGLVAARAKRCDVFSPGELVRDENGRVIGCRGLQCSL